MKNSNRPNSNDVCVECSAPAEHSQIMTGQWHHECEECLMARVDGRQRRTKAEYQAEKTAQSALTAVMPQGLKYADRCNWIAKRRALAHTNKA